MNANEQTISHFRDEHFFLSNFSVSPISINYNNAEYLFTTGEHCFQGMKIAASIMTHEENLRWIQAMSDAQTPNRAKYLGRSIKINIDKWNEMSYRCMQRTQELKYEQNPLMAEKLCGTFPKTLIEGTSWNDTLWGVNSKGEGQNLLGKILMELRATLMEA